MVSIVSDKGMRNLTEGLVDKYLRSHPVKGLYEKVGQAGLWRRHDRLDNCRRRARNIITLPKIRTFDSMLITKPCLDKPKSSCKVDVLGPYGGDIPNYALIASSEEAELMTERDKEDNKQTSITLEQLFLFERLALMREQEATGYSSFGFSNFHINNEIGICTWFPLYDKHIEGIVKMFLTGYHPSTPFTERYYVCGQIICGSQDGKRGEKEIAEVVVSALEKIANESD